jgi:hypothetical protein
VDPLGSSWELLGEPRLVAGLLQHYFRELPTPLLPEEAANKFAQAARP